MFKKQKTDSTKLENNAELFCYEKRNFWLPKVPFHLYFYILSYDYFMSRNMGYSVSVRTERR